MFHFILLTMYNYHANTRAKLISGYAILIVLLFISVSYIYTEMKRFMKPNETEKILEERKKQINQVSFQLYKSEIIAQSILVNQTKEEKKYILAIDTALSSIHNLYNQTTDTIQRLRFDTIISLLDKKKQCMKQLVMAINKGDANGLYENQLDQWRHHNDSLLGENRIERKTMLMHSSHKAPKQKKGFFKRFAEVFSPKEDTTSIKDITQLTIVDTIIKSYNLSDSVHNVFDSIKSEVNKNKIRSAGIISKRAKNLQANNLILSDKLNQLMKQIEKEEQTLSDSRLQQAHYSRVKSIVIISISAILASALAIIFLILIWRDFNRINHYRTELEKAKQEAEGLLSAREQLMLTITHDMKAPLSSIIGYIDLLTRLVKEDRAHFYLQNMSSSSNHLLNLVHSFLDYLQLDSQKAEIALMEFNLGELLEEIQKEFNPLWQQKNIDFSFYCERELYSSFISDPLRLRQIIENLLTNAFKFTSIGKVSLYAKEDEGKIKISISDTGSGMTKEEMNKIFHEFVRLPNAQGKNGVGLGLAITKKLVTLLKGQIDVESTPKVGTCFCITLPLQRTRFVRVLIIDDDAMQRDLTQAMLESCGATVENCETYDELVDSIEQKEYDVLLTDMQMPAISGIELTKKLRHSNVRQAINIPVIAITARNDLNKEILQKEGFADILHKPFTQGELYAILCKYATSQLHFDTLTAFTDNDSQAEVKIIQTFITETKKNREQMMNALLNNDAETLFVLAHRLRPLFSMLGVKASQGPLEWLEKKKGSGNMTDEIRFKVKQVIKEIDFTIQEAEWLYKKKNIDGSNTNH